MILTYQKIILIKLKFIFKMNLTMFIFHHIGFEIFENIWRRRSIFGKQIFLHEMITIMNG